jgi:cobalt/nickel transport system permease protein
VKFFFTLMVVLFIALLPRNAAWAVWCLGVVAVVLLVALLLSGVGVMGRGGILWRVLLLEPFVAGVALLAFFTPGGGWQLFLFLVARCTLALLAMVLFGATTSFPEMLRLFRALHVPWLLVTTLALMHRYLFVLTDELARMRRARRCRTFTGKAGRRGAQWHMFSVMIGQLFLRASERADRVYDAMRARGWAGGGDER